MLTDSHAESGSEPVTFPAPNCQRPLKASENYELAEVGGSGEADCVTGLADDGFGRDGPLGD